LLAEQIEKCRVEHDSIRLEALLQEQRDQLRSIQGEAYMQLSLQEQMQLREKLTEAQHQIEFGQAELVAQRDTALEDVRRLKLELEAAKNTRQPADLSAPQSEGTNSSSVSSLRQAPTTQLPRQVTGLHVAPPVNQPPTTHLRCQVPQVRVTAPHHKVIQPAWLVQHHSVVTVKPVWAQLRERPAV